MSNLHSINFLLPPSVGYSRAGIQAPACPAPSFLSSRISLHSGKHIRSSPSWHIVDILNSDYTYWFQRKLFLCIEPVAIAESITGVTALHQNTAPKSMILHVPGHLSQVTVVNAIRPLYFFNGGWSNGKITTSSVFIEESIYSPSGQDTPSGEKILYVPYRGVPPDPFASAFSLLRLSFSPHKNGTEWTQRGIVRWQYIVLWRILASLLMTPQFSIFIFKIVANEQDNRVDVGNRYPRTVLPASGPFPYVASMQHGLDGGVDIWGSASIYPTSLAEMLPPWWGEYPGYFYPHMWGKELNGFDVVSVRMETIRLRWPALEAPHHMSFSRKQEHMEHSRMTWLRPLRWGISALGKRAHVEQLMLA